ncbi:MAG: di-trans,poly-cis-decaprenylcistransferase [Rhodoferax sp.]|jgi:undecaprenyl diphosphate synthase|nr:di-trans,poly-cis-decaprenylcistransferase [Rhodoferax sp.]
MAEQQVLAPLHVAIVMDGNGRWASKRFLPRVAGHKQGVDALKRIVSACPSRGISVLTVFAFSSENWNRPAEEVSGLMDILALALSREVPKLQRDGVQIRFVGARDNLSARVKKGLEDAEKATADNAVLTLNVCFNYGGRWDIVCAAARLSAAGVPITEDSLSGALSLAHSGDPDLVIRTGNEKRLSNFLLWQAAYSELYFSPLLWPDFDEAALDAALLEYTSRERRFGKTSEQITGGAASGA